MEEAAAAAAAAAATTQAAAAAAIEEIDKELPSGEAQLHPIFKRALAQHGCTASDLSADDCKGAPMMRPLVGTALLRSIAVDQRRAQRQTLEPQRDIAGTAVRANHEILNCDEFAEKHRIFEETTKPGARLAPERRHAAAPAPRARVRHALRRERGQLRPRRARRRVACGETGVSHVRHGVWRRWLRAAGAPRRGVHGVRCPKKIMLHVPRARRANGAFSLLH